MSPKTLLLGGSGFLGSYFLKYANNLKGKRIDEVNSNWITGHHEKFENKDSLISFLKKYSFQRVINCIALADIEKCDSNPKLAYWLNAEIPSIISDYCNLVGASMTHISTDAVFDGESSFRKESDIPNPISVYGKTKKVGEDLVLQNSVNALIARVNFYGFSKRENTLFNFFYKRMVSNTLTPAFEDVFFTPMFAGDTVETIVELHKINAQGIYHVVGNERISKFEFACRISDVFNYPKDWIIRTKVPENLTLNLRGQDLSLARDALDRLGFRESLINEGLNKLKVEIKGKN